jgi:hypothetical protein
MYAPKPPFIAGLSFFGNRVCTDARMYAEEHGRTRNSNVQLKFKPINLRLAGQEF